MVSTDRLRTDALGMAVTADIHDLLSPDQIAAIGTRVEQLLEIEERYVPAADRSDARFWLSSKACSQIGEHTDAILQKNRVDLEKLAASRFPGRRRTTNLFQKLFAGFRQPTNPS